MSAFRRRSPPISGRGVRWRVAGWTLAAWILVGSIRAADRYFSDPFQLPRLEFGLWEALTQNLLWAFLWAALTPLIAAMVWRLLSKRPRWLGGAAPLLAGAVALPVLHCFVFQLVYPPLMGSPLAFGAQLSSIPRQLPALLPTQLLTYAAVVAGSGMIACAALARERDLKASQLNTRLARARLEALQGQLHPHFLFNTLNSILPLVFRDRDAASRTVVRLAELLRLSLRNEGRDTLPLRQELALLRIYLEIQQTRFQDRLAVRTEVEPGVLDAPVPNLILQPLVENAIKHGISARPGAGSIEIVAGRAASGRLRLLVRDDGPGPSGGGWSLGEGVGLKNTRDRLELLYGAEHAFELRKAAGRGCEAWLEIPFASTPPETVVPAATETEQRFRAGSSPAAQWVVS